MNPIIWDLKRIERAEVHGREIFYAKEPKECFRNEFQVELI